LPAVAILRARRRVNNTSFGPDALGIIGNTFDAAWSEIAGGVAIEVARLKLGNAVLSVASEDSRDVEVSKRAALQAIAGSSQP
jgi:hypothetical protein